MSAAAPVSGVDQYTASVATTATLLAGVTSTVSATGTTSVAVYNASAVTVYLGGSTVTTANGFPLAPGATFAVDLRDVSYSALAALYACVATGTASVNVLAVNE